MTAIEAHQPANGGDLHGRRPERGTSVAETPQAASVRAFRTSTALTHTNAVKTENPAIHEHFTCEQVSLCAETCQSARVGLVV